MKSVKITLLVLFIFCNKGFAQDVSLDILKKEVLKSQASRISSMIDADIYKLKNLLADDLTYAHTTGWR